MKKKKEPEINTKKVFRKILPFLLIFIFSLSFATNKFVSDTARRARAADEGITVTLNNLSAPVTEYSLWTWKANLFATKHIGENISFLININWCDNKNNQDGFCQKKENPSEYITYYLINKNVIVNDNGSFVFQHQSFPCGRAQIEIYIDDNLIGTGRYNTGISCNNNQVYNLLDYEEDKVTYLQADIDTSSASVFDRLKSIFQIIQLPSDSEEGDQEPDEGLPPAPGSEECPIPGATILCGSRGDPINGCEHCGEGYTQMSNCENGNDESWGTAYGLDLGGDKNTPVYLPEVAEQRVIWTQEADDDNNNDGQSIIRYSGVSMEDDSMVWWIQFHHARPGSGIGIGQQAESGAVGAKICNVDSCNHIHVQLSPSSSRPAAGDWVLASQFLCR